MEKMAEGGITRRKAVGGALALAGAAVLGGCSRKTAVERIAEQNEAIIAELDLSVTRLPLGSVVETAAGRFMVAGHKCLLTLAGDGEGDVGYSAYDYYGLTWPLGIEFPGHEALAGVVFSAADVTEVLFIGLVNEEDKDMRDYLDAYDVEASAPNVETGAPLAWVRSTEAKALEQQLRMQGVRSAELYGDSFDGGLLFGGAESGE